MPYRRHIGIYAYRAGFLQDFVNWGPCWLETTERLEQLRALWHGVRIHVADALEAPPTGVDTQQDLERVRRLLEFVCLGNICRSPTAEGVLRHKLREAGLAELIEVDSAGTGHWHVGKAPDTRSQRAARMICRRSAPGRSVARTSIASI